MKTGKWKIALLIPYIALWQIGYLFALPNLLVAALSLFVVIFLNKSDFRITRATFLSIFYGVLFIVLLIEPGIALSKLQLNPAHRGMLQAILYSMLFAFSMISLMHGIILKALWKKPFYGMTLSSVVYILSLTPFLLFTKISGLPELILFNISFVLVLSYYMGFLFLKANLKILPGIIFLEIYSVFSSIGVSITSSQLFLLVWQVISISVVLFITEFTIKEPVRIKKIFKAKKVRKKTKISPAAVIVGLSVLFVLLVALPLATHETHYAIADPTDSMYPVIKPGSMLIVSHIEPSSVKIGTIIVFHSPWDNGTLFAHQVIGFENKSGTEYFVTKGVNNPAKDPLPVPVGDLVGRVYTSIPYIGYTLIYSRITAAVVLVAVGASFATDIKR